jgi:hypothetical protein
LNLARGQQYATNQHSGKNNQALPFPMILAQLETPSFLNKADAFIATIKYLQQ